MHAPCPPRDENDGQAVGFPKRQTSAARPSENFIPFPQRRKASVGRPGGPYLSFLR